MRLVVEILPDSLAPQIVDKYARSNGWRSVALDGEINAFAGKVLCESILGPVAYQNGEDAANAARTAAVAQARAAVTVKLV